MNEKEEILHKKKQNSSNSSVSKGFFGQQPVVKKVLLSFLVTTICGISFTKGAFMLISTYSYYLTGVPWYEWLNYFLLSLFMLICIPMSLFFLNSVYIRRLLRIYLFGIIFINIFEVIEQFDQLNKLFLSDRPFNLIFILIESFSAFICWLLLLRQIEHHSFIAVPIASRMGKFYSIVTGIKNRIHAFKHFILYNRPKEKKILTITLCMNIVIFSGLLITMIPENTTITLQRPLNHQMDVIVWTSGSDIDNTTLDIMGAYNMSCYAWCNPTDSDFYRYKERNVTVFKEVGFPSEESDWIAFIPTLDGYMDYWDIHPELPFRGFITDTERVWGLIRFNQTRYERYLDYCQTVINHVADRGYEMRFCQYMTPLNDLRDGDHDVSNTYYNPYDPVRCENLSALNWMVYRSESAILYDEPYQYFTYQFASQIRDYMKFMEDQYGYERGFLMNKSGMSIGVTTDANSFYVYDPALNPNALEELIQDAKICHACEIGEIAIFILGELDTQFLELYGNEGLEQLLSELDTYESVSFQYKRRATFFGNLKLLSNITGSVFGFFYSDVLYEEWVGLLAILWLAGYLIVGYIFTSISFPKRYKQSYSSESSYIKNSKLDISLRVLYIGLLAILLITTYIMFRYPEFWMWIGKYI